MSSQLLTVPAGSLSSAQTLTISVIVPVRNEERFVGQTLEMLLTQDYPRSAFEIIVVDGMSQDGTASVVQSFTARGEPVRLLQNPRLWSSSARNLGVSAAHGDLVLIVDGHCELPDRQHFRHLVEAFNQSGADVIGRPQPLTVRHANVIQRAIALSRASRLGHHPDSYVYATVDQFVPAQSVGAAYRRDVFERVGYFDERFDACEDVDFNYRVDQQGLTCFLATKAKVYYVPRSSLGGLFRQLSRYGRGRVRLARKHPQTFSWKTWAPAVFVALLFLLTLAACASAEGRVLWLSFCGLYLLCIGVYSAGIACRARTGWAACWLPVVFATIHLAAGMGVLQEWLWGPREPRADVCHEN